MSRANQQNNSLLRKTTHLGLLGALAASFASACVSSSNGNNATGGTSASAGGDTSGGGANGTGGATTATSLPACNLTGVVDGCQAVPNPPMFSIDNSCNIGLWALDGASFAGFWGPWCTSTIAGSTTCDSLTKTCSGGSLHLSGSYSGLSTGNGNAGLGTYQEVHGDAGAGCPMMNITGFTGVTIDINVTTVPNNYIYFGLSLANGNSADKDITTVPGLQSLKFPFASFANKNKCGSLTEPGVTRFTIAFAWFNDNASHPVDVTFSNLGFY
jgi:hypothetical protein